MDDTDQQKIADLAMRALDTISSEYGEDAELCTAVFVFEVKATNDDGEDYYHSNFKILPGTSPNHAGGLLVSTGNYILDWEPPS